MQCNVKKASPAQKVRDLRVVLFQKRFKGYIFCLLVHSNGQLIFELFAREWNNFEEKAQCEAGLAEPGVMDFWRSVNPISTGGSLLCPTHYYLLRASRAIKNEGNYVLLSRKPTNIFLSGWFVITSFFIHKKMKISILLENKDSMQ